MNPASYCYCRYVCPNLASHWFQRAWFLSKKLRARLSPRADVAAAALLLLLPPPPPPPPPLLLLRYTSQPIVAVLATCCLWLLER